MEKEKLSSLILALQGGDAQAATDLYNAFHQDLYYYILKTANDSELAEDLLQDTFMEIYQTIGQLNEPAAFVTWSRQIAYHRCTAYFRKRREILADEDEDGHSIFDTVQEDRAEFIPDEALDKEDLKQTIHEMIAQLPMEQRSALLMRYFDELSVKEIAEIQGVSEGTVKSRLNYGRKAIQQSVESYEKKNGIKLHCVGIVPLLLWLFREYAVANGISLTAGTASATYAAATTAATTAASSTAVAAAEGATLAAAEGAKVIAMEGVKTGAKVAGKFAIKKIIAGVAAAAIVTGGAIAGTQLLNKPGDASEPPTTQTVNLNDYIIISDEGYDGYGAAEFLGIDCKKLAQAYGDRATCEVDNNGNYFYIFEEDGQTVRKYFGSDFTTAEQAAENTFNKYTRYFKLTPRILSEIDVSDVSTDDWYAQYNKVQSQLQHVHNGDIIEFVWASTNLENIELLETIFDIDITWDAEGYRHTVSGLTDLKEYAGPVKKRLEEKITINLKDYAGISLYGTDGEGKLYDPYLKTSTLFNDISLYIQGLYNDNTLNRTLSGEDNHRLPLFTLKADKTSGLSNGDIINFTWEVNERGLQLLQKQVPNITFDYSDFSYEVTNLLHITEIDPFDPDVSEVLIKFYRTSSNISGYTTIVDWQLYLKPAGHGKYQLIKTQVDTMGHTGYWSNGDQVKLTILESDEYILEKFGLILTDKTGIFTVTGLIEPEE